MARIADFFGVERRCPLPGHTRPAIIDVPLEDDGDFAVPDTEPRLLCQCHGGRWYSLGEVTAALAYGKWKMRSPIEAATWTRRLAWEIESFEPVDVPLPPLPPDAPDHALIARHGFALLLGLRWADGPRRPAAYSVRFVSAWCRMSYWHARDATSLLRAQHIITEVDHLDRRGPGYVALYLPGSEPPA